MTSTLTEEQTEIFQFARTGHNLLITGQAGTGKSWVVNTIIMRRLQGAWAKGSFGLFEWYCLSSL